MMLVPALFTSGSAAQLGVCGRSAFLHRMKWILNAHKTAGAWGEDELAADALRERLVHAGVLSRIAGCIGGERLELLAIRRMNVRCVRRESR